MAFGRQDFQNLIMSGRFDPLAAALRVIPNVEADVKFGHCPNVASGVATDVWERGGTQAVYIFPDDGGEVLESISVAADIGQTIKVSGLDVLGITQVVTYVTNGVTPVAVPGVWTSIYRAFNAGATKITGDTLIRGDGSTSSNIFAALASDDQQTAQAIFQVPSNRVAAVIDFSNAVNRDAGSDTSSIVRFSVAKPGEVFRSRTKFGLQKQGTSNLSATLLVPLIISPSSRVKAIADTSALTDVSASIGVLFFDSSYLDPEVLTKIQLDF